MFILIIIKLPQVKEAMSNASKDFQNMKRAIKLQQRRQTQIQKVRTVNTVKWKLLMLEILQKMALSPHFDNGIIEELARVVKKMPQQRFVEAIINLQPYKPKFKSCYSVTSHRPVIKKQVLDLSPSKDFHDEATTTTGSLIRKISTQGICAAMRTKRKKQLIAMFIQDDMLSNEISAANHPFNKIIEGFVFILEKKYKLIIDKQVQQRKMIALEEMVNQLTKDYQLIQQFFKMASAPIVDIINTSDHKQRQKFAEEVHSFMVNYLRNNEKICLSFRRILRYFIKNSKELAAFIKHCPLLAQVEKFAIPPTFQIQGCYAYTTSQIIAFSELSTGKQCLTQLAIIRDSIYRDIDQFYKGQNKTFEVSSEVQLQILKFSLVKVQIFVPEILTELKMLQILYGEEEISYHFDQASYIHSQMIISLEAIQHNL